MLIGRLTSRVRGDSGFTLVETIIAITVIFGSLTALAYTATASFRYQDVARQRQTADGVADKVMEEIRGLAYDKVVAGLSSTDLTGDANIVSCSGTYRFLSCSAGTEPGSGEKIVNSAGLTTTVPLVPHRSSTAPNSNVVLNGIAYTWSTYVTQDDSVSNAPYRVTVVVTWTGGLATNQKLVRIQSLFWSPLGCSSTSTHPFSAPCQPFLLGNGTVPNGDLEATGSIAGTNFSDLDIELMGVSSSTQTEQVSSAEAAVHPVSAMVTESGTQTSAGGVNVSSTVDGDPNTGAITYARQRCGTEVTCSGATLTAPSSGATYVQVTAPTTTTGEADSAIAATASNVCPPTMISASAQTDNLPCSGAAVQQPSAVIAVAHLHGPSFVDVGDTNLLRAGIQTTNSATSWVDRVTNPAPVGAGCTPAASTDGCVAASVARTYGNLRIGGLPANMTSPFSGNCSTYFVSFVGYSDAATAAAGDGSPLPSATAPAGTLYYWDTATSSCKSVALNASNLASTIGGKTYTTTQSVSGTNVTATLTVDGGQTSSASTSTAASPATGGSVSRTNASAQVVPPVVTVNYTLTSPGVTIMNVVLTINLGTLTTDATYAAAPSGA
jgi:type II secretory pathway pseudopilin PulG